MKRLFLTSIVRPVINQIVKDLNLPDETNRKLVFINTPAEAEGGDKQWLEDDKQGLIDVGFEVSDYTIVGKTEAQIKDHLADYKYIFVSGGNTFYFLQEAQKSGFVKIIRDLVLKQEKIYIGSSAGAIIAGPDINPIAPLDEPEKAPNLKGRKGFGLVNFVVFPHWGSSIFKDLYLESRFEQVYNTDHKIVLLTDNQYIQVEDDWYRIVDVN